MKPYEVELCVAEVGDTSEADQLYRLTFDGSIVDESHFVVMGGQADAVASHLRQHFAPGMGLTEALKVGVQALSAVSPATAANGGTHDQLPAEQLEVAVLDRRRPKRAFRRVVGAALRALLVDQPVPADDATPAETAASHAPSAPAPGTPPGLGDPAAVDTAGGAQQASAQGGTQDGDGGGTDGDPANPEQ
jgi:proteasome alpha subunit